IEHSGTHAQGSLGFQMFLRELGLDESYAQSNYWVSREVCGDESRVDIQIAAHHEFIVHIENKIYSKEGQDQTGRECRDLERSARELCVKPGQVHSFFLTLTGELAANEKFEPLPWRRIADILNRFAERAKAPEVSMFAIHYARALRRMTTERIDTH